MRRYSTTSDHPPKNNGEIAFSPRLHTVVRRESVESPAYKTGVREDAMSRINTNIAAYQAIRHLSQNSADLGLRLERLSTGLRINRGRDDPAGLISSERLRSEIRTIQQAIENSERAGNVLLTAEGALNEVSALLLDLQSLIVSSANDAALTAEEVKANQLQIDSILTSIDRIANTTTFAGKKLIDGTQSYLLSGASPAAFNAVRLFSIYVPKGATRDVTVEVVQSAQTGRIALVGAAPSGVSTTSAVTVQIRGNSGSQLLTFGSGTTLAEIRSSINTLTALTGISAVVSTPSIGGVASSIILNSQGYGSDSFVSVEPISGNFVSGTNSGTELRGSGVDVGVLVDGLRAQGRGTQATVRANGLDARFDLDTAFAQTLSSADFTVYGGGSLFQLTQQVNPAGQLHLGFDSVHTTRLGDGTVGLLYTLRTGEANDMASKNFPTAQAILAEAIDQVSSYRGRIGNLHRNQIDANINAQGVALENVTASESVIRDADIAVEVSALTRAQILVQSTQHTLQIANSVPNLVLSLLQ